MKIHKPERQDRPVQQPLPRHGSPVAAALLQGELRRGRPVRARPTFVKLADAYGIPAWSVEDPSRRCGEAIQRAMATPGPALIEFLVDPYENIFPMVVPGNGARGGDPL